MSPFLLHDVRHKEQEAKRLPCVEQWIARGGCVERLEHTPPEEFKPREAPEWNRLPSS